MQEALESILQAEKAAKARQEEASSKAAEIRADADSRAEALISEARRSTAAETRRRIAEAHRLAEERLSEGRADLIRKDAAFYDSLEPLVGELAASAALISLRTELET